MKRQGILQASPWKIPMIASPAMAVNTLFLSIKGCPERGLYLPEHFSSQLLCLRARVCVLQKVVYKSIPVIRSSCSIWLPCWTSSLICALPSPPCPEPQGATPVGSFVPWLPVGLASVANQQVTGIREERGVRPLTSLPSQAVTRALHLSTKVLLSFCHQGTTKSSGSPHLPSPLPA